MYIHIYMHACIIIRVSDPDPVGCGVFAWFSNFSGSGSGFQISLDPDSDPVSAQILEQKTLQKGLKSDQRW